MENLKALIVDDQPAVRRALTVLFEIHDVPCAAVSSPGEALAKISEGEIGVVIQDMNFGRNKTSGEEGIKLFRQIKQHDPELPVLLLTAWTSLETAVELIKEGANDYLAKPWDDAKLLATVQNLLKIRALQLENTRLHEAKRHSLQALSRRYDLCGIVYAGEQMHEVVSLAASIARSDVPVLITGPSGAGKEKIAEIIQANSSRRDKPFVRVNAGAIPDDLMESELFGAEPGAFTGSQKLRIGRFETAHGGTLFLDEVGNLSPNGQVKLLRVVQSGEFERLGSSVTRRVDVRIISATNTDLMEAIQKGRFREDLYFRLNVIELRVSPLAERPEDVIPLAEHFLAEFAGSSDAPLPSFSLESQKALMAYSWPGNVRELRNVIQRATLIRTGPVITPRHLGMEKKPQALLPHESTGRNQDRDEGGFQEKIRIERALIRAEGVISRVASEMGISRQALYRKMEKLGIALERRPKE